MIATSFARTAFGTIGAAVFAATCLVAAVAPANATPVTASKTVSYADLNLDHAQGRAALQARIKSAAKSVCTTGGNDNASREREARCVKTAIATATRS